MEEYGYLSVATDAVPPSNDMQALDLKGSVVGETVWYIKNQTFLERDRIKDIFITFISLIWCSIRKLFCMYVNMGL